MLSELVVNELQELQQEHQGFKVTDLESATWCFRKLKTLEEQQREYDNLASREIERINTWYRNEKDKLDNQKAFFNGLLAEYSYEQRKENPKFKLSTPYGKVSFRKQPAKWIYDEELVLNNLKSSGLNNLIRVKEEINKSELKKVAEVMNNYEVLIDGEIIEGISILEEEEAIKIEVAE